MQFIQRHVSSKTTAIVRKRAKPAAPKLKNGVQWAQKMGKGPLPIFEFGCTCAAWILSLGPWAHRQTKAVVLFWREIGWGNSGRLSPRERSSYWRGSASVIGSYWQLCARDVRGCARSGMLLIVVGEMMQIRGQSNVLGRGWIWNFPHSQGWRWFWKWCNADASSLDFLEVSVVSRGKGDDVFPERLKWHRRVKGRVPVEYSSDVFTSVMWSMIFCGVKGWRRLCFPERFTWRRRVKGMVPVEYSTDILKSLMWTMCTWRVHDAFE